MATILLVMFSLTSFKHPDESFRRINDAIQPKKEILVNIIPLQKNALNTTFTLSLI